MYESPCTASGSLRPDVGTQSLAVSMLERFEGGGQLDYVISAKRRHYYEYALGALIIY